MSELAAMLRSQGKWLRELPAERPYQPVVGSGDAAIAGKLMEEAADALEAAERRAEEAEGKLARAETILGGTIDVGMVRDWKTRAEEAERALERIREAWSKSWDCSADPGHRLMNEALAPSRPSTTEEEK